MAHRSYRLSLSPTEYPEVRRVVDFDGRATLEDVHQQIMSSFDGDMGMPDHLYAFFLSGKYWDGETEYVDPRADGRRAHTALLFRLGLKVGQQIAYVFDYGDEWRATVTVEAIEDRSAPLAAPTLVESVGEILQEEEQENYEAVASELVERLVPLAQAVVAKRDAESALALASEVNGDRFLLSALDDELGEDSEGLLTVLFGLGLRLSEAGATEDAIAVLNAYSFMAKNELLGDLALVYARAGRREEALAQVAKNLDQPTYPFVAEKKAGDLYRELGELDAAEAYYRRAIAEAENDDEEREASLHLSTLLLDQGREAEAEAALAAPLKRIPVLRAVPTTNVVGRNDPCPCGSGKKYKKCHGA